MKKRTLFLALATLFCVAMSAADLTGKRIYVNPGHGSFGPNDRPMATIPYPNLPTTGMPDTLGFYESNTDLWKCLYLGERLEQAGAYVMYSRTQNGPWPYEMKNGDYPDYSYAHYQSLPDYEKYNRNLSEICEEVEANNMDLFISVHSNAATDGTTSNYPLWLYRGRDSRTTDFEKQSYQIGADIWPYRYEMMSSGYDPASAYATSMNLRGDIDFYGSSSTRTSAASGKQYTGYLGVLKHGAVGGLYEGYFHTYQPARHRALNHEHCYMEGYGYYRGIIDYFGADKDTKGYILGTVKDLHEKISHPLFNYSPKTNDQWLPCNGAVVTLYKAGVKVGEYQVDDLYNGVFYFGDLEPGNDYTLDAYCDGYWPLSAEYKKPISVKANTVIYPFIYLENEDYEQETIVYETYPEPELPEYVSLAGKYNMNSVYVDNVIAELEGKTIRRSLVRDDNTMFILAVDEEKNPYLYLIDPSNHTVKAQLPTDFCTVSAGGNLKLSDIALTADGYLIGCNEEKVTFSPSNKWLVYKWSETDGNWTGEVWINTTNNETAGNYNNAIAGTTLAYAGSINDGVIYSTAYTTGSDAHGVRYFLYTISEDAYAGAIRNQNGDHTLAAMGHDIQFTISPEGDNKVIITASNIAPMEWTVVNATASAPVLKNMPETFKGTIGVSFFKYAHHKLMLVPNKENEAGVALYDVTAGIDNPKEIELNVTNAPTDAALYAKAIVEDGEINIYLTAEQSITKLTTANVNQPAVANIYAYGLNGELSEDGTEYTFSWTANAVPVAGSIVFLQEGQEVGRVAITSLNKENNSMTLKVAELPFYTGTETNWGIELQGEQVPNIAMIHNQALSTLGITRAFCAVDNSPESDYFGRIYISDRAGANLATSGLHAFNQDYTRINTSVLKGGRDIYGSPYQIYVDDQGYIWISDGSDGYSGIVIADPANLEGEFEDFFEGATRDGQGLLKINGVEVGSSCLGLSVYGTGKDAKLLSYNEDAGSVLPSLGLAIYNIGTEEGTYKHVWSENPSSVIKLTGQAAYDGYPLGCTHGIWVAQRRTAGNNNASATALKFYDWAGNELLSSANAPYKDIIDGNASGACAISPDEKLLVMIDGSKNLLFFDVTWEGDKPTLSLKYEYACGMTDIREMHFDFAGNLVTSGENNYFRVFTIPQGENITMTPAKKALTISKQFSGEVEGVLLDQYEVSVEKGEQVTLVATVMPKQAENTEVVWSSDNETVATVVDGVVTALATGNANITVTTKEGNFTATCAIEVVVSVKGIALDQTEAELYKGEYLTLIPTFTPEDATNKNVVWSSSDESVAKVTNGEVRGVGAGEATITVRAEDGGYTASCKLTVKAKVKGVKLNLTNIELYEDETATLIATINPSNASNTNVSWSSTDESVATVQNGVVTAIAPGEATIIVTTEDGGHTAECAVVVKAKVINVTSVELDKTSVELYEGETVTLVATVMPDNATDKEVVWTSDNEAVATVVDGVVTAVSQGVATITVTTVDGGLTATCEVTVIKEETGIDNINALGVYYRGNVIYNESGVWVNVYDIQGRNIASGSTNIDLTPMPMGVYIMTVNDIAVKIMR